MKKNLLLFVAILFAGMAFPQQNIKISPDEILASSGEEISVPIVVNGFGTEATSLLAIEFYINFDNNVLTYCAVENINGIFGVSDWFFSDSTVTNTNGRFATNWVEPTFMNNLEIPDGTVLFELKFIYNSGETILDFDEGLSVFSHLNPDFTTTEFDVEHLNGLVKELPVEGQTSWNGVGNWSDASHWDNGIPTSLSQATIESGEVTILTGLVNTKVLTVNENTVVKIMPNKGLTVDSLLTNNGMIWAVSDTNGTGSLIVNSLVEGETGNYKMERYLNSASAHTIGAPLEDVNVTIFDNISEWDEQSASFSTLQSGALESGKGYLFEGSANATYTFMGPIIHQGDVPLNLSNSYTGEVELKGLNLISNPYPSAIEWNNDWLLNKVGKSIYLWQDNKYLVWNGYIGNITNGIIPAMQGFIVKAYDNNPSVIIPNSARLHSSQPFYKETADETNLMVIEVGEMINSEQGLVQDIVYFNINTDASEGFDQEYDAYKIPNADGTTMVYSILNNNAKMAIDVRNFIGASVPSVSLGFRARTSGTYYLRLSGVDSFDELIPITLEDLDPEQQAQIDMRNDVFNHTYVFSSNPVDNESRFILYFSPVGIDEFSDTENLKISLNDNLLHISDQGQNMKNIEIYDIFGRELLHWQYIVEKNLEMDISQINGIFIVKVSTQNGIITKKFLR